ncbi:hypothetical protein lerEdw1_009205, partial [Lerista edwardsae]
RLFPKALECGARSSISISPILGVVIAILMCLDTETLSPKAKQNYFFSLFQDQFLSILEYLMEEKESIQVCEKITKEESEELLKQAKAEKEKMLEEFRQLIQFLEKRKNRLLTQIEAVEMEIAGKRDEHMAKLSEELAALQNNIQEIEQKLLQPPSEFLKVRGLQK